jgi:4-amino-4-deoxy-L-arabinose transferase-like glycosyltransferase
VGTISSVAESPLLSAEVQTSARAAHSRWITFVGLGLIVILGAWLRLSNLAEKSVTHVEMYVPGIRMPQGISVPGQRITLPSVLTGTFSSDTHPPGYYVLMWAWTKCFGTSVWALRIPAVLLGVGCIPLIFWLGTLTGERTAGWIAAVLLAVHGHHVFWSQVARMFTLTCFLGLLATCLLLVMAKEPHAPKWLGLLYVTVVLLGVSCHIFFWALLGTHICWTFLNASAQRQALPGVGRFQLFAVIVGSPLLAFAAYQNANELATLSNNALVYAREFLQFAFLFPLVGFSSGVYPLDSDTPFIDDPHLSLARWLFFALSLGLFVIGLASVRASGEQLLSDIHGVSSKAWLLGSGLGTLAILFFVFMAKRFLEHPNPTLRATELMVVLPAVLAGFAVLVETNWERFSRWVRPFARSRFLAGEQALVLSLAVIPFVVLVAVSRFKPIFNARGMLLVSPYLLLVLTWGIVYLSRFRVAVVALLIVLGVGVYSGSKDYQHMSAGRANYRAFAAVLAPQIDKADLVFIHPSWYSTPTFYYLNSGWDRYVGQNYQAASKQARHARIWALLFYDETMPKQMAEALSEYQPLKTIRSATCACRAVRAEELIPLLLGSPLVEKPKVEIADQHLRQEINNEAQPSSQRPVHKTCEPQHCRHRDATYERTA